MASNVDGREPDLTVIPRADARSDKDAAAARDFAPGATTLLGGRALASAALAQIAEYSRNRFRSGFVHVEWIRNVHPWKYEARAQSNPTRQVLFKPWFAIYNNHQPGTLTVRNHDVYARSRADGRWRRLAPDYAVIGGAYWDPSWGSGSGQVGDGAKGEINGGRSFSTVAERDGVIIHGWGGSSLFDPAQHDGYLALLDVQIDKPGHTISIGIDMYDPAQPSRYLGDTGISAPFGLTAGAAVTIGFTNRSDLF